MKPLPSTSGTQSFAQSVIARKKAEQRERERDSFSLLKGASSLLKESERGREAEEKEMEQEGEPVGEGPMDPKEAAGKLNHEFDEEGGQRSLLHSLNNAIGSYQGSKKSVRTISCVRELSQVESALLSVPFKCNVTNQQVNVGHQETHYSDWHAN